VGVFCISVVTPDGEIASLEDPDVPGVKIGFTTEEEAKGACEATVKHLGNQWMDANKKDVVEVEWNEDDTSARLQDGTTVSVVDLTGVAEKVTVQ